MTNKAEDKFYFGKPGQPERFDANSGPRESTKERARSFKNLLEIDGIYAYHEDGVVFVDEKNLQKAKQRQRSEQYYRNVKVKGVAGYDEGRPDTFGLEDACWDGYEPVGTKQKDGKTVPNCVPMKNAAGGEEKFVEIEPINQFKVGQVVKIKLATGVVTGTVVKRMYDTMTGGERYLVEMPSPMQRGKMTQIAVLPYQIRASRPGQPERFAESSDDRRMGSATRAHMRSWIVSNFRTTAEMVKAETEMEKVFEDDPEYWARLGWRKVAEYAGVFSRPGQPEKFDASSLDRGSFAEASQSPMLGKLLAAKVMPEGGWRAVQVGSDTLVISFEDADLARDFGRRAATKGYNATSPVQAIGRYWNVEVKNG